MPSPTNPDRAFRLAWYRASLANPDDALALRLAGLTGAAQRLARLVIDQWVSDQTKKAVQNKEQPNEDEQPVPTRHNNRRD